MVITRSMSGLPATIPAVLANASTSISEPGHAWRRLRINGVVSNRSPKRRSEITSIRDGTAGMFSQTSVLAVQPDQFAGLEQLAQCFDQNSLLTFVV